MLRLSAAILLILISINSHAWHTKAHKSTTKCEGVRMACAKTVSSAVSSTGRIWSTWAIDKQLYLNFSDDIGQSYSTPQLVNQVPELITTRGENRPKIALDKRNNVYLSWVTPLSKRFSANVRFSYWNAKTNTFSSSVTINNDNLLTGHSFNEMVVTPSGDVYIAWLDGRAKVAAAKKGQRLRNSEIYLAHANFNQGKATFDNTYLTKGTCVCCRLAMDLDNNELPMIMWRHVFGDNYRDHGFLTMKNQTQANPMKRVSFENWQVNGCPHQGPTIVREVIGEHKNRVHMSWFNNAPAASGLFYGYTDDNGTTMSHTNHFASKDSNPEHPFLALNEHSKSQRLQMVWREFDGNVFSIKGMSSKTGAQWSYPRELATAKSGADYPYILRHPSGNYLQWHIQGKPLALIKL